MLIKPSMPPAANPIKPYRSEMFWKNHCVKYKLGMIIGEPMQVLMAVAR